MSHSKYLICVQFILGISFGVTIACAPTRFGHTPDDLCGGSDAVCITENDITTVDQPFTVGAGKVDILFVNDNSASMSVIQNKLATRFSGFVEKLDQNQINYQIGITTTDKNIIQDGSLISFASGSKILKNSDGNRVNQFNAAIVRPETKACENFIKSSYNTYGSGFLNTIAYENGYAKYCASNDERGIYNAFDVIANNRSGLIRPDAHLSVIVVSNEDVRSSLYESNPGFALSEMDTFSGFNSMMDSSYKTKFWEFHSIITKDSNCGISQQQAFTDHTGTPIRDASGSYVIGTNIGKQYAAISSSASKDIDGQLSPRGKILSICDDDYAGHFSQIASHISDASRMLTLKCTPMEAPVVKDSSGQNVTVPFTWDNADKIIFHKGSERILFKVKYRCYNGVE